MAGIEVPPEVLVARSEVSQSVSNRMRAEVGQWSFNSGDARSH